MGEERSKEDMPYTHDGITPDIVINPHAFSSRMTVGQFFESIMGKHSLLSGKKNYATAFQYGRQTMKEIEEDMKRFGYPRYTCIIASLCVTGTRAEDTRL
jgi:DNA-directed RNA polymerase subunit B